LLLIRYRLIRWSLRRTGDLVKLQIKNQLAGKSVNMGLRR